MDIPPAEQAQMLAELRRARYGSLLALHILLLCVAGRTPTEIAAVLFLDLYTPEVTAAVEALMAAETSQEEISQLAA